MKPPARLIDDPSVPGDLRAELHTERTAHHPYDVEHGLAQLQSALGAPVTAERASDPAGAAAQAPSPAPWLLASTGLKLLVAAAAAAAVVVSGVVLRSRDGAPPDDPPADRETRAVDQDSSSPSLQAPTPAREPRREAGHDAASRREIEQLGKIKRLVDSEPGRAYRMAQAGHREFGQGMLYQEREALAVLSLWNLGQRARARQRARAFLDRFPHSPLRPRLQQRLRLDDP